jgi:choline dehydrogenase-like flavoprotein
MKKAARGLAKRQAQGEELPSPENRVMLAEQKDEFGFPLARIVHTMDENATKLFHYELESGLRILRATRSVEAWFDPRPGFAHINGGAIMGTTASDSVTNSYGRNHDVGNLFIAGAGLFPTAGTVNPTFTLHALTLRTAEYIDRALGQRRRLVLSSRPRTTPAAYPLSFMHFRCIRQQDLGCQLLWKMASSPRRITGCISRI